MDRYTIIKEAPGVALLGAENGSRTVVGIDRDKGQVYSAMPGDMPADGGRWHARISDAGIDYVSKLYSRSYANRIYREIMTARRIDT